MRSYYIFLRRLVRNKRGEGSISNVVVNGRTFKRSNYWSPITKKCDDFVRQCQKKSKIVWRHLQTNLKGCVTLSKVCVNRWTTFWTRSWSSMLSLPRTSLKMIVISWVMFFFKMDWAIASSVALSKKKYFQICHHCTLGIQKFILPNLDGSLNVMWHQVQKCTSLFSK